MESWESSDRPWRFDRREFAGSLGDLGTLLPLAIGLITINGLSATGVLLTVGAYYILSGIYFRSVMPVQPMKVIGAYAITAAMAPGQVALAGFTMGVLLLLLALTGAVTAIGKAVPLAVVRGVQFTTGILLLAEGVRFMLGRSSLQSAAAEAEPYLLVRSLGPVPIGVVLGTAAVVVLLLLTNNRAVPGALAVIAGGVLAGLLLGAWPESSSLQLGLHGPKLLPWGLPSGTDLVVALSVLVLPQMPMTIGNAIIAQADLSRRYFGVQAAARQSHRALAVSMGLANVACALLGGMPLCHGAGGLAAHHRFGARGAGSNLMIGSLFLLIAVLVGDQGMALLFLLPLSVLGALLVFAGAELALTVKDLREAKDLLVVIVTLGVALAANLGLGFVVGLGLAWALSRGGRGGVAADPSGHAPGRD